MIGGKSLKHECSIVEDLQPLYHKRTLQNDTMHFIEQHMASCERCQQLASTRQNRPLKRTLAFFHLVFIVLSFMFALNSSLLGRTYDFSYRMLFSAALLIYFTKIVGLSLR